MSKGLKWNYYIGVQRGKSSVALVTKINNANRQAYWRQNDKPMKMTLSTAKDISWALCVNGYRAFVITTLEEYETQPFIDCKDNEQG